MEKKILKLLRFIAAAAHLSGLGAMIMGSTPSFLLLLMSCSLLLFLAADNQVRQSNSVLLGNFRKIGSLVTASVFFGVVLEASNLVFNHRHYVGVPADIFIRWGYFTCMFALFIPLILEIERTLENLGLAEVLSWRRISSTRGVQLILLAGGLLLLVPVGIWPDYFYPLFWIALLLLTDSLVNLLGHDEMSISGQFEEGYFGQAFRLIVSGVLFGFLWEFWNFRAGTKWFYSGAGPEEVFLFELPALEFWCYAFTALGAYGFFQLYLAVRERLSRRAGPGTAWVLTALLLLMALAAVLTGLEYLTIASFRQIA